MNRVIGRECWVKEQMLLEKRGRVFLRACERFTLWDCNYSYISSLELYQIIIK